jgi:hypothetical protein
VEWRRLRNGKLHDQYPSPNIIPAIKSSTMTWRGLVGERRDAYRVLVGKP